MAEFVTECIKGDYSEGERILLKDYSELWMKDYAEKHLRKKTVSRYKSLLGRIVYTLGHKKLCELKPPHLIEFYNMLQEDGIKKTNANNSESKCLSPRTIHHHHSLLSSMLQDAVEWGLIKENICKRIKPPKVLKEEKIALTIEQSKQLLALLNEEEIKYKTIVILAIFTGFRRGEIMGLEWSDINFGENSISINRTSLYTTDDGIFSDDTKTTKSKRITCVPSFVINLLKEYKAWWDNEKDKAKTDWIDTDRLFIQWNGLPMHPDTITKWFTKFVQKNKLPNVTFHGLRHTHGSILLAMGMDIASVAEQLGHTNIQMLIDTYAHNVKKQNQEVAKHMSDALIFEQDQISKIGGVNGGASKIKKDLDSSKSAISLARPAGFEPTTF